MFALYVAALNLIDTLCHNNNGVLFYSNTHSASHKNTSHTFFS